MPQCLIIKIKWHKEVLNYCQLMRRKQVEKHTQAKLYLRSWKKDSKEGFNSEKQHSKFVSLKNTISNSDRTACQNNSLIQNRPIVISKEKKERKEESSTTGLFPSVAAFCPAQCPPHAHECVWILEGRPSQVTVLMLHCKRARKVPMRTRKQTPSRQGYLSRPLRWGEQCRPWAAPDARKEEGEVSPPAKFK